MIPNFNADSVAAIKKLLEIPRKVVITTHYKPDGDAMGSSLALWHYLVQNGHQATVISPSDWPDFLSWMPGCGQVVNFEHNYSVAKQLTTEADIDFLPRFQYRIQNGKIW
jgi:bifunctional oligoribonuclease and PAP phosphatase NrnA